MDCQKLFEEKFKEHIPEEIQANLFRTQDYMRGAIDMLEYIKSIYEDDLK